MRKPMIALALAGCSSTPALAAGKPLAIAVACSSAIAGAPAACKAIKSGGNGRAVTFAWWTADGTAKAGVDYAAFQSGSLSLGSNGTSWSIPTLPTGSGSFIVAVRVTSGTVAAQASTTVLITGNVAPPAPPPPPPPPPVPAPAPLAAGGWAKVMQVCEGPLSAADGAGAQLAVGTVARVMGGARWPTQFIVNESHSETVWIFADPVGGPAVYAFEHCLTGVTGP